LWIEHEGMNEMAKQIVKHAARSVVVVLASSLAGCGGFNGIEQAQYDANYTHPISVEADVATLNVSAVAGQPGLSSSDKAAIENFASAYRQRGHGPLTISTPSGSPNAGAAAVALSDVRDILAANGVTDLAYTPYRASGADSGAPLILSFKHYVAKPTACGDWSADYAYDPANGLLPNHGCATQNNLAVMIADPADLAGPRTMTAADAERRNTVLEKYRAGESTATERSDQDSGAVSEVEK
jgi:pilus assembly protein CpaD